MTVRRAAERGQVLTIAVVSMFVFLLVAAVAIDGGYAFVQRRTAQNAADLAAIAGSRVVADRLVGLSPTDAEVQAAISSTVAANGGTVAFGAPDGPRYVDDEGQLLAYVGSGTLPASATGVTVPSSISWRPFIAPIVGIDSWTADTFAVARSVPATPLPGGVLPIGVSRETLDVASICPPDQTAEQCGSFPLTDGTHHGPGQFGWLKFGCFPDGGQQTSGSVCSNSANFVREEVGPPPNSFGCCSAIPDGTFIRIGGATGNMASVSLDYYIDNDIWVVLPVFTREVGPGSNGYYEVTGFAVFQITATHGAKDIDVVLRGTFFTGPTDSPPLPPGTPIEFQLVR